jgi:hypothetical protein
MSKPLPFTQASLARAIRGVEKAGKFVIGVKPDGTLIIGDKPVDVSSLVSAKPQSSSPAPGPRFGDKLGGGSMGDYFEPASKWEDKRADELDSPPPTPKRRFGERSSGVAAQSEEMATPPRAHDRPRGRRGGGWGFMATVRDPKVIESYRAAGFAVYEDGELEELIKKSPMGKRETAALGGFFRARGEPADVKGAGLQITSRLITRGYIEIAESRGKYRKHRITPAGEAEWLRLTKSDPADQP